MLSIGKLAAGPDAGRYYVEQVAQGREDYYAGEGEAPGQWAGAGAATLGLAGEVDEGGLDRLLRAQDPATGDALRRPLASGAVAGFDLTFRAPKSVGVLWGVAEGDVAREVRLGHEAAVTGALKYLEREACRARRGAGGAIQVRGEGFVAAAFRHRASRAGDPLLHTHVVVANATRAADGRWTALDGRELYRHAKTAGYLYQAVLRAELSQRLGVEWDDIENGTADLLGVSRSVVEHFSQRRAEIVEHMRVRGERSARAAQVATLATRRGKDYGVPVDRLREEWRARAAEHGLDRWALRDVVDRTTWREPGPHDDEVARRLEGPDGLTRERSTFTRRDVVQAFAEAARDGARVEAIEHAADAFIARREIVAIDEQRVERRYTTRELLRIERNLLERAERAGGTGVGRADADEVEAAVAARPTLTEEQRELVAALTRDGDRVQVVRAPAGTGKTFALDAAREAWQRSGVPVLGCALSARAACELRDQTAIDATTVARLTHALERGAALRSGGVLVVDEAGMVGTRDLAKLADAAARAEAKLVLVGDDRQLPEVDAGGAYRALAERLGATELREVRRQRHPWDRDALTALRGGDTERFAREYHRHDRIVVAPSADDARQGLVDDWWRAFERGDEVMMIAHRRADVADLNDRARERMRDAGRLGPDELDGERAFAVGDRVVATRNDRRLGILNGQSGTLTEIADGHVSLQLDGGDGVDLPSGYAEDGGLEHGYAITAHRAQGATVDRTFVLGSEGLYREWAYTALSRHREEARFYVTAAPTFLNRAPEPLRSEDDVAGAVTRMLDDSRAEHLALHGLTRDHIAEALAEDLDRAQGELDDVEERLAALHDERDQTRWYQRSRRDDIDTIVDGHTRAQAHWRECVEDLQQQLAERPAPLEPPNLWRAADPLCASDIGLEPDLEVPAPDLGPDVGMDFGP